MHGDHLEGTVSQILYIGPSFYSMKSRKINYKKWQKMYVTNISNLLLSYAARFLK